jgi:ribosomal protein S12 methylthiotransferase
MERDSRFLPYFDIPFQHAAPEILTAMNRHGTAESYVALAETIRSRLPTAVIRTTFLAGFPGETNSDFNLLLQFQEKLRPDWLGCFTYSREEGTPAFTMKKQVPKKIAAQRQKEIENKQMQITEKNMDRFVGQKLHVLLEEQFSNSFENDGSEKDDEGFALRFLGRLYCHAPEVDGSAVVASGNNELPVGNIVTCKVVARRGIDLEVQLI